MLDQFDKKTNPFKVPSNYFEDFNNRIMDQLPKQEDEKNIKRVALWDKILPWGAVAAILWGAVVSAGILEKGVSPFSSKKNKTASSVAVSQKTTTPIAGDDDSYYSYMQDESVASMYDDVLYSEN